MKKLENIASKKLSVIKTSIFFILIFGGIVCYIFRDKHHSLLYHILTLLGVVVMIFVFSGAFLVIPYSDIWNRTWSLITGKKSLGKDKLYRAIYEDMDEIFEYRKEFKQKYPGKAGDHRTEKKEKE